MAYDFGKVVKIGGKILMSKGGLVVPKVNGEEPIVFIQKNIGILGFLDNYNGSTPDSLPRPAELFNIPVIADFF